MFPLTLGRSFNFMTQFTLYKVLNNFKLVNLLAIPPHELRKIKFK